MVADPDPRARYATEGLRLARLLTAKFGDEDPSALDVLAAALAEAGRFDEAERTARARLGPRRAPAGRAGTRRGSDRNTSQPVRPEATAYRAAERVKKERAALVRFLVFTPAFK